MFARVEIIFQERRAILVPSDAIIRRGEATVLFVVRDDTVVERRVRTGYVEGGRSEIVEGLTTGESIVTAGQQGLREGMKVRTASGGSGEQRAPGSQQPSPVATPGVPRP